MTSPSFVMHAVQSAHVDKTKSFVMFETRLPSGHCFYFQLTRNQFLSLNDSFLMIKREQCRGDYPLGDGFWLSFKNYGEAMIYDSYASEKHPHYFKFHNLKQYLKGAHHLLLSVLLSYEDERNRSDEQQQRRRRRRRHPKDRSGDETRKRPLPDDLQSADRSGKTEESCTKRKTSLWSTTNADMSDDGEDCAVFSKWDCADSGGRNDARSVSSTTYESLPSPAKLQLSSDYSSTTLEGD